MPKIGKFKLVRVGVCGYSAQQFNEASARKMLEDVLEEISDWEQKSLTIVSGLTNVGIPKIAYAIASDWGMDTVGIACSKAQEYDCFPCDKVVIVGEEWGEESDTFLDSIDCLVRIGGGKQSLEEVRKAKEWGMPVVERDLPAIPPPELAR